MNTTADQLALPLFVPLPDDVRAVLASQVRHGWQHEAACAGDDSVLFDYPDDGWEDPEHVAAARRICDGCPVQVSCIAVALLGREWGIWAGTTDAERNAIRDALIDPARRANVLGPNVNDEATTREAAA